MVTRVALLGLALILVTRLEWAGAGQIPALPLDGTSSTLIVIAHRGASGHRPEHTLEAYDLAIDMGADFVEPDLVATKDGVLVARHENEIGETTDVADRFPERRTTKSIDGRQVTGWFTEDFTLAELKTLRARERLPFRSHAYDGQFAVPTLDEVLVLLDRRSRELGRTIGVYPETKHPSYFRSIGLPLEPRLVDVLKARGRIGREAAVFIQSFEAESLRVLRGLTALKLVQLLDQGADTTSGHLAAIAQYADGVGVNTRLLLPANPDRTLRGPTAVVAEAHRLGLVVHAWTLRSEPVFLSPSYERPEREYEHLAALGVDGIFTDFPDVARSAFATRAQPGAR